MVNVSDSQFGGPGFESRSDHYLDSFLGSPEFLGLVSKRRTLLSWKVLNDINLVLCLMRIKPFLAL